MTTTQDDTRLFAVVGATGQQGGATVDALLSAGARVRGLTRDPSSEKAQALAGRGVEMVRAEAGDADSLRDAFTGVDGVYVMTTPNGPDGAEGEARDGIALVDAANAAGVPHVVLASVGGAERGTGIPHFESKRRVEEHLAGLDQSASVLRPVFFMENLTASSPSVEDGTLVVRQPVPGDVPVQMVAVRDVGAAGAAALLDPGSVPGGALELVGDELTLDQAAAAMGEARGVPARFDAVPVDVLPSEDLQLMFRWFADLPAYEGDVEQCRRLVPDLFSLRAWLARLG